jgi:hypothetical protein
MALIGKDLVTKRQGQIVPTPRPQDNLSQVQNSDRRGLGGTHKPWQPRSGERNAAHGVSCGSKVRKERAPKGRKKSFVTGWNAVACLSRPHAETGAGWRHCACFG